MKKLALLLGFAVAWPGAHGAHGALGDANDGARDETDEGETNHGSDADEDQRAHAEAGGENAHDGQEAKPDEGEGDSVLAKAESFGHLGQFGLRLNPTWGYRMVFRYPDSPFCREPDTAEAVDDQQAFCGHNGPWALDAALSYGVLDSIEPYLWGRFGLQAEAQTNTQNVVILGAGVRIYTMSDDAFKIFVEPAVGLELEDGAGDERYVSPSWPGAARGDYDPEYKRDLIFHLAAGPHWDFGRQFGGYVTAGLTVGVLRYIHASMELQFGLQFRMP